MDKKILLEIENTVSRVLSEQMSKVSRNEFNRVQFKIEELQNTLNDTIKEFRKLDDSIPNGLKTLTSGRMGNISSNLNNTQKQLMELKDKIRQYKRKLYQQQMDERKDK